MFCLESGFLSFLELQKSSTSNVFRGAEHNGKGLKAPAFTVSEILHSISQNTFLLRKWLSFIPRAPETSTSKFLGVLNTMAKVWKLQHSLFLRYPHHFLKTHVCLESGFLSFLGLQKPQLVSFWGCWTQWQRFESSSIHCFWDSPQHFLKTHLCLESGFLLFLELQKSLLVSFQQYWTQWWAIKQRYFEYH